MPEIPIIPPENIVRREKASAKERKGMIDPDTYKNLKGFMYTGKTVLGQLPTQTLRKIDVEDIDHLEKLFDNSISILENINFVEEKQVKGVRRIIKSSPSPEEKVAMIYSEKERKKRTLERLTDYTRRARNILEDMESKRTPLTRLERDNVIIDLRKKLNKAEKINKTCDNSIILAISEIDSELSRYPDMLQIPSYFSLIIDSKRLKQDFINNCKCTNKITKIKR